MSLRSAMLCGLAVLLSGCVQAQREDVRGAPLDAAALGLSGPPAPLIEDAWWRAFGDPQLDWLIEATLARNPRLEQALARVRASSAEVLAAGAGRAPDVTLDVEETWQRFSEHHYVPPPYAGGRYWVGTAGANLAWTLDFWGRQAATIHQAQSAEIAARLDERAARLAVSGSLAQAYLDLNRAYALAEVATRVLAQRERLLEFRQQRASAGLDASIELNLAQVRVADARTVLEQTAQARELAVHRLAALAAHGADIHARIGRPALALDGLLPLPDSLPIDLLARRPDVLAARARIEAADAGRVAAKAAFYPELSLTAFAGVQAIGLDALLKGGSTIYGGGPALHLPIFDSGRLRALYRRSTAELDAAVADYNETVLNAVRETADQLSLVDSLTKQRSEAHHRLAAAQRAAELTAQRYRAGLVSQLVALESEAPVLAAQQEIIMLDSARALARIALLLTLGGNPS